MQVRVATDVNDMVLYGFLKSKCYNKSLIKKKIVSKPCLTIEWYNIENYTITGWKKKLNMSVFEFYSKVIMVMK